MKSQGEHPQVESVLNAVLRYNINESRFFRFNVVSAKVFFVVGVILATILGLIVRLI